MVAIANKVNRFSALVSVLLLSALLGACSSSDDNDSASVDDQVDELRPGLVVAGLNGTPAEDLVSPWLAVLRMFRNPAATEFSDFYVDLFRYDDGLKLSDSIEFYTPELDTCEINDLDAEGGGGEGDENTSSESISGGASVTINSGSGPWLVMGRPEEAFPGYYLGLVGGLGVLPADATLSIPGEGFPNVPAYPLLDQPPSPVRLTPAVGFLSAADVTAPFTWMPMPELPGSSIQIVARAYDAAGDFQGFPAVCRVVDDGEFMLPQDVIDAFSTSELQFDVRFERAVARHDLIDGVIFHQYLRVAE